MQASKRRGPITSRPDVRWKSQNEDGQHLDALRNWKSRSRRGRWAIKGVYVFEQAHVKLRKEWGERQEGWFAVHDLHMSMFHFFG